jgi:hypothetical protein
MKILLATLALALIIAIASLGATTEQKNDLEQRVQALEVSRWNEQSAIDVVAQRVWDRATSCNFESGLPIGDPLLSCGSDPVLAAFAGENAGAYYVSLSIFHYGQWQATQVDNDHWQVTATLTDSEGTTYGPYTWNVWENNGFIISTNYQY